MKKKSEDVALAASLHMGARLDFLPARDSAGKCGITESVMRTVEAHRPAIEAGDLDLMMVMAEVCDHRKLSRPDWLNFQLAEWALATFSRDSAQLAKWPEPKMGSSAKRQTRTSRLTSLLETAAVYRAVKAIRKDGGEYLLRNHQALDITAQILNSSKFTVKKQLERAGKYATDNQDFILAFLPEESILDDLPVLIDESPAFRP